MSANGKGLQLIKSVFKHLVESGGFEKTLDKLKIVSAGGGRCVAELKVELEHENQGGTLHGGLTATLVDSISTYALMTHEKGSPGVSVDIHVTYMKGARDGEEIIIDANTLKVGKRLAFLDVLITNKRTGELIAKGSHTKFVG